MNTQPNHNDIYIKPSQPSALKQRIDKTVIYYMFVMAVFAFSLIIEDIFSINWHVREIAFDYENRYWVTACLFLVPIIAILSGSLSRFVISSEQIIEMMSDLQGVKVKRNISLILSENKKLTVGDLKSIVPKMKKELLHLHQESFNDIAKESEISTVNKRLIQEINIDLKVLDSFIKKNQL